MRPILATADISLIENQPRYMQVHPTGATPLAGWRVEGRSNVEIYWSTGFAGVVLKLDAAGDSLVGLAHAFHDVIGPVQPTAPVVAKRIACPT